MDKHLFLIHGRSFKPSEHALKGLWFDAIKHGVCRDCKSLLEEYEKVKRTFVYYGDISNRYLKCHGRTYNEQDDLSDRSRCLEDLKQKPGNAFLGEVGEDNYRVLEGASAWRERLADVFAGALDVLGIARIGIGSIAPDIRRYWEADSAFGSKVRWRLTVPLNEALCKGEDVMLVAHSLGSMIAYDVLWKFSYYGEYSALREQVKRRITLVTLGSPLSNETVKRYLKGSSARGRRRYPNLILRWDNFAAEDDYICHDQKMSDDYGKMQSWSMDDKIVDHRIYNLALRSGRSNPHHGAGYLVHPCFIDALARWLRSAPNQVLMGRS